ncbi:MAG: hypothetical protein Q7K43_04225 [Candidatus Woesearchaeota archaeon]|nr:hypothetical protein [Candidatus Woesearchaeota archaeon]
MSEEPACCKQGVRTRIKDFWHNTHEYPAEYTLLKNGAITLFILLAIQAIITFLLPETALPKYAWWVVYTIISVVSITVGVAHLKAYITNINCMTGMMIGMTLGMQTGMMIGTILGATNGLFIGGIIGMILAVCIGIYSGRCCGIMGVMEGTMAGSMGGIMGAMTGVMFSADNILWFMPVFMLINIAIMIGFSIMLYEEIAAKHKPETKTISLNKFSMLCTLAVVLISLIILWGPRTGLAALG